MSGSLFKTTLKANWTIALALTMFIMIYVATSISMFNPESAEFIESMLNVMPEGMLRVFGFENLGTDLTQYIANYLYGFIMLIFPFIYTSIIGNRLIAKHVDSGSMAYLLATPNTRNTVSLTQAVYHITSTTAVFVFITAAAILMSAGLWPGMLKAGLFIVLNLVTLSATLVAAGISFLASCIFSDTKYSLAFGVGIPLLFVVFRMIHGLSDKTEWMKYLSIYTVIDIERILEGGSYALFATIVLLGISAVLYAAGIIIFNKKSLVI